MSKQAVGYCRVSGLGQVDGDGFQRQKMAISKFCFDNDFRLSHYYEEEGVSGTVESMHRPKWVEMMLWLEAIKAECGEYPVVIIERLDRLARDMMISEHILLDLQSRGIEIISTCEPDLGSEEPTRVLMRRIMAAISEYDKQMIVLKLRGARERKKAKTGRCEGQKPFGFHSVERPTVDYILSLREGGFSLRYIANACNNGDMRRRDGGQWDVRTVSKVLVKNREKV